jgi:SAM-dependent methyltransferase
MGTVQSIDSDVYYTEQYWDSFPYVKAYIQKQVSGNPKHDSLHHFKEHYAKKPFKHGLFLNCGNGWLERWCITHKIVEKATGFDCSEKLIDEANRKKGKLPIDYFVADANTIELPENIYDLVVNSAAIHHVQYINRFCEQILRAMKPNGIFFHYDYIGPHRNQYPIRHWQLINRVNNELPENTKKEPLLYAHIPSMLSLDPSEAIHSELIIETLSRFFTFKERHDIAGMIAYNILSLNSKLKKGEDTEAIRSVVKADEQAFKRGETPPLFTYMVTTPKKEVLKDTKHLQWWQLTENLREKDARLIEWTYSIPEYIPMILHGLKHHPTNPRIIRLILYPFARLTSALYLWLRYPFLFL